jgi:hypothetical protein
MSHAPFKGHNLINHHKKPLLRVVFPNHQRRTMTRGCDNPFAEKVPKKYKKTELRHIFLIRHPGICERRHLCNTQCQAAILYSGIHHLPKPLNWLSFRTI